MRATTAEFPVSLGKTARRAQKCPSPDRITCPHLCSLHTPRGRVPLSKAPQLTPGHAVSSFRSPLEPVHAQRSPGAMWERRVLATAHACAQVTRTLPGRAHSGDARVLSGHVHALGMRACARVTRRLLGHAHTPGTRACALGSRAHSRDASVRSSHAHPLGTRAGSWATSRATAGAGPPSGTRRFYLAMSATKGCSSRGS